MKIAPAFSTGPLWQFSSHKTVFFSKSLKQLGAFGFESHPLRQSPLIYKAFLAFWIFSP
jgi:hypothetical protein